MHADGILKQPSPVIYQIALHCMQPVSECSEKERLRRRCRAYLLVYWETMHRLDLVSTHREFEEAHERAQGVRLLFLGARAELHSHMEQHGCELF